MQKTKLNNLNATESYQSFVQNYSVSSTSVETIQRFKVVKKNLLRLGIKKNVFSPKAHLKICDIGCGAGTQCALWEEDGHNTFGLDINAPLLCIAKERLQGQFGSVKLCLGMANELPYQDAFFDICLAPELLEHVNDWESCLDEFTRVLKPGGMLFLSTSNFLCPIQHEFNLPLYSWYPKKLKKFFVQKAMTSNPELANYATFPAVNWFSYYSLKKQLSKRDFQVFNRFDLTDPSKGTFFKKAAIRLFRTDSLMKLVGNCLTPSTIVAGIKKSL